MLVMAARDGTRVMREIRALLMEWDALGVADEPAAADEYDCMIGPLYGHLRAGADAAVLRDWIAHELVDHFGLQPHPSSDTALAAALVAWRERRVRSGRTDLVTSRDDRTRPLTPRRAP
jgi:hypothetical protein